MTDPRDATIAALRSALEETCSDLESEGLKGCVVKARALLASPDPGAELLADLAKVKEALERTKWWNGTSDEDAIASFERVAETFRRETGFLRPGKSQPIELTRSDESRRATWDAWIQGKQRAVCDSVVDALALLSKWVKP